MDHAIWFIVKTITWWFIIWSWTKINGDSFVLRNTGGEENEDASLDTIFSEDDSEMMEGDSDSDEFLPEVWIRIVHQNSFLALTSQNWCTMGAFMIRTQAFLMILEMKVKMKILLRVRKFLASDFNISMISQSFYPIECWLKLFSDCTGRSALSIQNRDINAELLKKTKMLNKVKKKVFILYHNYGGASERVLYWNCNCACVRR